MKNQYVEVLPPHPYYLSISQLIFISVFLFIINYLLRTLHPFPKPSE